MQRNDLMMMITLAMLRSFLAFVQGAPLLFTNKVEVILHENFPPQGERLRAACERRGCVRGGSQPSGGGPEGGGAGGAAAGPTKAGPSGDDSGG